MSLVNKMLRDLDARRVDAGERAALPAAVTPLAAHQEPSRLSLPLWFGALAFVTILGGVALYKMQNEQSPTALAVPVAAPVAPSPVVAPVMPPAVPVTGPAPMVAMAPAAVEPVSAPPVLAGIPVVPQSLRMADELSVMPVPAVETLHKATVAPKTPERKAAVIAPPQQPVAVVKPGMSPAPAGGRIEKQARLPSAAERAEAEYRRAVLAHRQGSLEQAAASYRAALEDYPEHSAARQTLAALLIEAKRFDEAEEVLLKGTELTSARLASTLALARLKVERNQADAALELLQKNAASGERSAEYQGFAGALLNRAGRSAEAVEHYQAATRLAPNEGRWWAGLGIALDAAGRNLDAREAYQKARSLPGLPADLAQHIEQRLR
jgi:MSHA biogenesis protein MshN